MNYDYWDVHIIALVRNYPLYLIIIIIIIIIIIMIIIIIVIIILCSCRKRFTKSYVI